MSRLAATGLRVGYGPKTIIDSLDVAIPDTQVTTIIGPNGCGKSTLLRAMANLLPTQAGEVTLDGTPIRALRRRDLARSLGVLPQTPVAPDGLIVSDLVARGRHPHQAWYRQWSSDDKDEVMTALRMTKVDDLADRTVDSLSGGQRQRVWISLVLAQQTDILFLDEPTTYLDLSHSIEVLELVHRLSREHGRTIVMVLHDLNLALRYSDNLVVMRGGSLKAVGKPQDVISPELLKQVFDLDAVVVECPVTGGAPGVPARVGGGGCLLGCVVGAHGDVPFLRCALLLHGGFLLIGHNLGCEHVSRGFRIFHALVARAHNIAHNLVVLAR